jgi:hypothetical protein
VSCRSAESSLESWRFLKARLKELGLSGPRRRRSRRSRRGEHSSGGSGDDQEEEEEEHEEGAGGGGGVMRTRANCLRVCKKGPIAVVYPEGGTICLLLAAHILLTHIMLHTHTHTH